MSSRMPEYCGIGEVVISEMPLESSQAVASGRTFNKYPQIQRLLVPCGPLQEIANLDVLTKVEVRVTR